MHLFSQFCEFILHLDIHLQTMTATYGLWIYLILFLIIFSETGLIITPFLPGDSLLFAAGSIAALGQLNIHFLVLTLVMAAILGNTVNYSVGKLIGDKLFNQKKSWVFNKNYLIKAHDFYEKYGGKAVLFSRFLPIVRTCVPFVAGMGRMNYQHFSIYNVAGAIAWVSLFCYGSYFFGNIPAIKHNFTMIIIAIIILSILPPLFELAKHKFFKKT